jgi:competence protein ComGC
MNTLKKQQGFLLIEVVILSVIISVALVSIVSMFTRAASSTAESGKYITAINLAQKRLEELKTEDAVFWQDVCNNGTIEDSKRYRRYSTINNTEYKFTTTPTNVKVQGNGTAVKLAKVTVRVEWGTQGKKGNIYTNQIQLISLYNKKP